ncbi:MAG: hypothetical protein CVT92_08715 [Bacteroidetes bacterium HGW-Bacteroidetes-1]|jgi:hypothetical protein|nr:MAG: hypothetical protein CVT92_08715 [Bacteroidetes bacterium HGW-Bacteroidetes-1]
MVDKLSKIVSWVLYGLMAVSALLGILFYAGAVDSSTFLRWGYVLLILGVVIALFSPIYGFILSPGNTAKLLISFGAVVLIAIVSYSFAGNTFSEMKLETLNITEQTSKMVSTGLLFTYITASIAILVIIFSSFFKIFK